MEGTLFKKVVSCQDTQVAPSAWVAIARHLGESAYKEEQLTQSKWRNNQYRNYIEWMVDTIKIHIKYGLDKHTFENIIDGIDFMPGVYEVFNILRINNVITALISGGFKYQADRAVRELKINHSFVSCEYFWDNQNSLIHWSLLPGDFDGKIDFMKLLIKEYGISKDNCVFVGDGENDRGLAANVGISIAFNGPTQLQEVTTYSINQEPGKEDFRAILPYFHF
jgi:phosphoserine phosphatase